MASRKIHIRKISARRAQRNKHRRDLSISIPIANRRLPVLRARNNFSEDLRFYNPQADTRRFKTSAGGYGVIRRGGRRQARKAPTRVSALAFQVPAKAVVCVNRQRRKEVLHAKRKTGRVGQRRPRFSERSYIYC